MTETPQEYGPLGPGATPVKDPLKALSGVLAGTLVLESITIFLALTVILQIDSGRYWTPLNWGIVVALGAAHFLLAFVQRRPWGLKAVIVLQVISFIAGFFVHWSLMFIVGMFIMVWWFVLTLRTDIAERMKRGMLVTQHLGTGEPSDYDK